MQDYSEHGCKEGESVNRPPLLFWRQFSLLTGVDQFTITPDELMELHTARSAAINAHPELIAENQKLMDKMHALNDKIDAAMIKTDPGVAPIIAKVEANRNRQPLRMRPPTPPPANPPPAK